MCLYLFVLEECCFLGLFSGIELVPAAMDSEASAGETEGEGVTPEGTEDESKFGALNSPDDAAESAVAVVVLASQVTIVGGDETERGSGLA